MFKGILIGLGVIVGLCIVGVMFSDKPEPITEDAPKVEQPVAKEPAKKEADDPDVLLKEMLEKAPAPVVKHDEYQNIVEYTLTNDTGYDFEYIEVQYDVFDKNNVKLANDYANISDVKNGQSFKVIIDMYQDGADHYEITKITTDALD
jgi:hypothetical protein